MAEFFLKRYARKAKYLLYKNLNSTFCKDKALKNPPSKSEKKEDEKDLELKDVEQKYGRKERSKVWAFVSGQFSQDFRGNPKYLFVYINKYRPDITAYWLCSDEKTIAQVKNLGFSAWKLETPAAQYMINRTGVLVVEQVKEVIPEGFSDVLYLNLWHGVGFKRIERKLFAGDISMALAKKYIIHGTFYRDHQLMTVTSPTIEKESVEDCGVDPDKFIRTGYLRCMYQQNFEPIATFEHDLRKIKGLPKQTKLIVYAPTYRAKLGGTFSKAIPDIEALYQCCEKNNVLLIFKMHPNMEKELGFLKAWETYGERKHFYFWDNQDDFYEILDQMDLAIVDYSGIISDMVAVGIKHYIRYIFDYDEYMQNGFTQGEYFERTLGKICYTFHELLIAIDTYQEDDSLSEFQRLNNKFWTYSGGKGDFEKVIEQALNFKVQKRYFPNLYSFDIFDTVFSRKVLDPIGIFYFVQEKMLEVGGYPLSLMQNYPSVRHTAELNVREYYHKTQDLRNSDHVEISFNEIFERLASVYGLSATQTTRLKQWEMEAELENVIPLTAQIDLIKHYVSAGEQVVLISDMYLPKVFIGKMLEKADPILTQLPVFLSSEYGVLKTSQKLFFEVYKSFEPFYDFKKWIHYGDNVNADQTQARKFGICTRKINKPAFNNIQKELIHKLQTYDAFLVAAMQARICEQALFEKDVFVCSYVSLCLVPYVDWVLRDSLKRGYETLYFISRDGYPLKKIADAIISQLKLPLKTKYIYASRRAWRIPSYIREIDDGFWQAYGNFSDILSKEKLFKAMDLDEKTFCKLFPSIQPDTIQYHDKKEIGNLIEIFKSSESYRQFLLDKAAEERKLVSGYLTQEINPTESFVFVEYWGRGYTQDCMIRLWQDITGENTTIPFYYSRSVLPTFGSAIRHNFTTNNTRQYFLEGIFANMPYKSVERYTIENGKIAPVLVSIPYDKNLYYSMENLLPEISRKYAALELHHPEDTDRMLFEFALQYYTTHLTTPEFVQNIATLVDSVAIYGGKREFAPPYTMEILDRLAAKKVTRGAAILTSSISMSVTRSSEEVKEKYFEMYQILPGDNVAGGRLLSEKEQIENKKFQKKYKELEQRASIFNTLYEAATQQYSIENKILIVENGDSLAGNGLDFVFNALKSQKLFHVGILLLGKTEKTEEQIAAEVATARYILVCSAIRIFCVMKFREGTEEILLKQSAFFLYNQGLFSQYFLKWKKKYFTLANTNDISVIQIPAESRERFYRRCYSMNRLTRCALLGNCNTDCYFDQSFIKTAKNKMVNLFPETENKKRILYMPTWRTRKECAEWLSMLDLEILQDLIGDHFCVIVNFNLAQKKHPSKNRIDLPGFSREISHEMTVRELICACDVIIGDYRDTFFESAIVHKPTYSTAFDYEEMIQSSNMTIHANDFERFLFCPIIRSSQDLVEHLNHIDLYDYTKMENFCKEMFAGCDGKSTERVVQYLTKQQ